jgi:hypothetical protein
LAIRYYDSWEKNVIYDLIVVGNGLAAQIFLFELFNVNNSQNFSIAQIYSEMIAPPTSLRSTATVSLAGIEEGISPLGDELRTSYFLFLEFLKKHNPSGVEQVDHFLLGSNATNLEKLKQRYCANGSLTKISSSLFKHECEGIVEKAYLISPHAYHTWFQDQLSKTSLVQIKNFLKSFKKNSAGLFECELLSGEVIISKKLLLATGAYARVFGDFHGVPEANKTQVVAGSFLERTTQINRDSFHVSIDGHNLLYRSSEKKLVLGSVSLKGQSLAVDYGALDDILKLFKNILSLPLGETLGDISDFQSITGLRSKAFQRRPVFSEIATVPSLYFLGGYYKNGYTFAHLGAKEMLNQILLTL